MTLQEANTLLKEMTGAAAAKCVIWIPSAQIYNLL